MPNFFRNVSWECLQWQKKQPHVKEESLTDWLLYAVSRKTNRVVYHAFTRNEEAQGGADWEWWLLTDGQAGLRGSTAYRFLVQAKKLPLGKDAFPQLSYGNRNGMQIDLLLASARTRHALPLYLYYSTAASDPKEQVRNAGLPEVETLLSYADCPNGAYLSAARGVQRRVFGAPRRAWPDADLLQHALGLSVCDLFLSGTGAAAALLSGIYGACVREELAAGSARPQGIRHFGESLPAYLRFWMDRTRRDGDWNTLEMQFLPALAGLSGMAVIDLRRG